MTKIVTWEDCHKNLNYQIERRRIDHFKKDHIHGPYLTVSFSKLFADRALNYVAAYTKGTLISVSHGDWVVYATFSVPEDLA